ncbi:MAG: DUF374 domain-containing protein [Planctomycetaceae bacterium]|nr:DUF374 domain-containing protein [Planctomycetaceae bacterium]
MKLRNRYLIRFCAWIMAGVFRLLFATLRIRIRCGSQGPVPYGDWGDERYLMCMWHDAIAGTIFGGRVKDTATLVSRHADGSYVADAVEMLGMTPIRGSSGGGGAAAIRQMMEAAKDLHICIATDGPRGPRHQVKDGILFLASVTGRGIVPVAFAAKRAWKPKGKWTDLIIPLPFTTVWLLAPEPIYVPPGLSRDQLGPYWEQLQQAMESIYAKAEAYASGQLDDTNEPLIINNPEPTSVARAA